MNIWEILGVVFILSACFGYRLLWRETVRRRKITKAKNKRLTEAMEEIMPILGNVNPKAWPALQQEAQAIVIHILEMNK